MADVLIMCEQLCIIFGDEAVDRMVDIKADRLYDELFGSESQVDEDTE